VILPLRWKAPIGWQLLVGTCPEVLPIPKECDRYLVEWPARVSSVKGFLERYPEVKLDLAFSDRFVDLVEDDVDLAIRIGQVNELMLIAQRITVR
jgi:DNA-binding transcriptional LysR family regulator